MLSYKLKHIKYNKEGLLALWKLKYRERENRIIFVKLFNFRIEDPVEATAMGNRNTLITYKSFLYFQTMNDIFINSIIL